MVDLVSCKVLVFPLVLNLSTTDTNPRVFLYLRFRALSLWLEGSNLSFDNDTAWILFRNNTRYNKQMTFSAS